VAAVAILALALVLRLGMAVHMRYDPLQRDAADYDRIGRSLADGNGFPPTYVAADGGPSAMRPPAYPLYLGAVYGVTGQHAFAARVSQAVLGTVTVLLIGLLAALLFGEVAGLAALAVAAVYPEFILMDSAILSETLYVPLMLGAILAALRHRADPGRRRWALLAGLLAGLSILTRQNGAVLLVPLALLLWTAAGTSRRERALSTASMLVVAGVVVLPWTIRNAVELHAFVPVATQSGLVLAGTYNEVSRHDPGDPAAWRPPSWVPRYAPLFRDTGLNEAELDSKLRSGAIDYAKSNPGYLPVVGWHNFLRLAHLGGARYEQDQAGDRNITPGQEDVGRFGFYVVAILALAGALTPPARRAPWYLWLMPVLLLSVVFTEGLIRLRAPIDPFLVLLASCALATLLSRLRPQPPAPASHATSPAPQ
jgi:4-amino-4-deoxy-L-arabinose transferase-like glycosyltransferase